MILTTSNILLNNKPNITTGASADTPANITEQDFSANYTSINQTDLVIEFGNATVINYVAVAGVKVKGNGSGTSSITLSDGTTEVSKVFLSRDNVVVFTFEEQTFQNLKITLTNATGDRAPTVSYIAAGTYITVPNNGEQSGYARQWLSRKMSNKTTTNGSSAPVAVLRKSTQLSGNLNIPNVTALFSQSSWQSFLDFTESNLFFINEDITKPESSYCCYEMTSAGANAHSSTRALNNLSLKFKVFTGL
jgi:hypothetical protein